VIREEKTFTATIYIAGDCHQAKMAARKYCMKGLCVTITPTTFVYTAGAEDGVAIGLINYPRFPKTNDEIWEEAVCLGMVMMDELCQRSFSVVSPEKTHWFTREDGDAPANNQ